MSRLLSAINHLHRFGEIIAALLLGSVFAVFLLQIVFRYVLLMPVGWTVEWVTIAWVWVILFGSAFALRSRDMIRLDFLYLAVSERTRRVFDVIAGLFGAAVLGWTLPACLEFVQFMQIERTAYLRWPYSWVFAVYIPFALSMIVHCLWQVGRALVPALARTHSHD